MQSPEHVVDSKSRQREIFAHIEECLVLRVQLLHLKMINIKVEFCKTNKCLPCKQVPDKISALKWLGSVRTLAASYELVFAAAVYNQVSIIGKDQEFRVIKEICVDNLDEDLHVVAVSDSKLIFGG